MKSRVALFLAVALALTAVPACKTLGGGGKGGLAGLVDCAQQAIRDRGLVYVGKVNAIIGSVELTDSDARVRLVDLGIDAGQDVLGCLLRDQGAKFAESSAANPGDRMSAAGARRAKEHLQVLEAEGWRFQ